ncbi:MAG: putative toxin-antitoxin system toxin component, PIN family [Verrucomicrobiales bacterium]|nr:putative toxin-antitoxin system toxin component, PIN family [Verrucomicrobiales bacterium]
MLAVIDTGVFVSGVFWRREPHQVLLAWKCGLVTPVISRAIFDEYRKVLEDLKQEQGFTTNLSPWLDALKVGSVWVAPVRLARSVCRDPGDDKFIEAALASGARTLIACDPDLVVLRRPFGIEVLTPRAWLSRLPRSQRRLLR